MLKLDMTTVEEPNVIDFSSSISNHSEGADVLADLENLWGENRDCFDSLLNSTNKFISDSDSSDDFSKSETPRFSTKSLISKLAPIGETFSRNSVFDSSVSNALSMINAAEERNNLNTSPHHNMINLAPDLELPEFSESQGYHSPDGKFNNSFHNEIVNFTHDSDKCSAKLLSALSNSAKTNEFDSFLHSKTSNQEHDLEQQNKCKTSVLPLIHSDPKVAETKLDFDDKRQQILLRSLVTPPVSPEEDSSNPLTFPVASNCTHTVHQFHSAQEPFHHPVSVTPKTNYQRSDIPNDYHLETFSYSQPLQQVDFQTYSNNCLFNENKVKKEPGLWNEATSGNGSPPKISRVHSYPSYAQPNVFQDPFSSDHRFSPSLTPWAFDGKSVPARDDQTFSNCKQELHLMHQQVNIYIFLE